MKENLNSTGKKPRGCITLHFQLTRQPPSSLVSQEPSDLDGEFITKLDFVKSEYKKLVVADTESLRLSTDKRYSLLGDERYQLLMSYYLNHLSKYEYNIRVLFAQLIFIAPSLEQELNSSKYANKGKTAITDMIAIYLGKIADKQQIAEFVKKYANNRLSKSEQMFVFFKSMNANKENNIYQCVNMLNVYIEYQLNQDCRFITLPKFASKIERSLFACAVSSLLTLNPELRATLQPILLQINSGLSETTAENTMEVCSKPRI